VFIQSILKASLINEELIGSFFSCWIMVKRQKKMAIFVKTLVKQKFQKY